MILIDPKNGFFPLDLPSIVKWVKRNALEKLLKWPLLHGYGS